MCECGCMDGLPAIKIHAGNDWILIERYGICNNGCDPDAGVRISRHKQGEVEEFLGHIPEAKINNYDCMLHVPIIHAEVLREICGKAANDAGFDKEEVEIIIEENIGEAVTESGKCEKEYWPKGFYKPA